MRFLQRYAEVDTGYGGRFVDAIEGLRSGSRRGERRDWFYYVNGIEADAGAAEREVAGSDRVWWDYRDWGAAMRVPAVVGSFPEPFLHGSEGKRFPVRDRLRGERGRSVPGGLRASRPGRCRSQHGCARLSIRGRAAARGGGPVGGRAR